MGNVIFHHGSGVYFSLDDRVSIVDDSFVCPSCDGLIPNNDMPGAFPGALSRKDNATEICSSCGEWEAFESMMGGDS